MICFISVHLSVFLLSSCLLYFGHNWATFTFHLAIRSSWSEQQSAPSLVFADCIQLLHVWLQEYQFSSVAQSCPTLFDPMNHSTPELPVFHQLPEFSQLVSIESVMPSNHLILCRPLLLSPSSFLASGSFPMSQFFASGGQRIGVSASATVLPMNIQDWFPFGLAGLLSLQSKRLSRDFSNITVQKHQFFDTQPSLWLNCLICTWLQEKP